MVKFRINKTLVQNSKKDPTKDRITKNIRTLCEMIGRNELVLPIFQTDVRWKKSHSVDLLNYQLQGNSPVAPISFNRLTLQSDERVNVTFIERTPISVNEMQGTDKYNVVDGQQRLTCNYKAFIDHEEFKSIVLDLSRGKFIDIEEEECKVHQIPVGKLYNKTDEVLTNYLKELELQDFDLLTLLTQIRTKFFNYDYIINNSHDLCFEDQINWFNVLNLAGSTVPEVQMRLTNLQIRGIDFYSEYSRKFCETINNEFAGIISIKSTEVSVPLACLNAAYEVVNGIEHKLNYSPIPSDQSVVDIYNSATENIYKYFKLTLKGLENAIIFIRENNLQPYNRIDYISYLTGFFVWNQTDILSEDKKNMLIEWYNKVNFTNQSNGTRREMFKNLIDMVEVI